MKYISLAFALAAVALIPMFASAHQHAKFEIGGRSYEVIVGSLNEPVTVDDKTGVDFRVTSNGTPVLGLEASLKVELQAGEQKKVLDLSPVYNTPGAYKAEFYPTVATTYAYRFFGTVNGTTIDVTFTCNPAGHAVAKEDHSRVEISSDVTRVHMAGSFGCPAEKVSKGFPEASVSVRELENTTESAHNTARGTLFIAITALVLGAFAILRKGR